MFESTNAIVRVKVLVDIATVQSSLWEDQANNAVVSGSTSR